MSNWLQSQFKAAEGLLEAVDRSAKHASKKDLLEEAKRSSITAPERQSKTGSQQQPRPRSPAMAKVEKQEQPQSRSRDAKAPLQRPTAFKLEPSSPAVTGLISGQPSRAQEPRGASPTAPTHRSPQKGQSQPPLASLFGTARSTSSEQPPWNAAQEASTPPSTPPKPQPVKATAPTTSSSSGSPERRLRPRTVAPESQPVSTAGAQNVEQDAGEQAGEGAVERDPSSKPGDLGSDLGRSGGASEEARAETLQRDGQHGAEEPLAGPLPDKEAIATSPGPGASSQVAQNGRKDAPQTPPGVPQAQNPHDGEGTPAAVPLPTTMAEQPEEKVEAPKNTADAVAEAIKAATAIAKGTEGGEEADGGEDARLRESRLVKMVEGLKRRLEQLKAENEQLEELLRQADAKASGRSGDVGRLEDALAKALAAQSTSAAELIEQKRAHAEEAGSLQAALQAARGRVSEVQGRLASVEENNERLLREQEMSEARMVSMLREEVAGLERRLEDERFAAASARQSFAAREQELEAALSEGGSALAKQQRAVEERARRLTAAENRAAMLEAEKAELQNELEEQMSRQPPQAPGGSPLEASELQRLREGSASLQAALSNSQAQRQGLEAEMATLRTEVDSLRNQVANSPNTLQLERRLQEVTDLLYQKQSQLERVMAERAAQQMTWERELASARDSAERTQRRSKTERAGGFVDGEMVVPMEDMGETYQRLANNKRVGKAVKAGAKMLDATTLTAVRFLRQYPLGRLMVFLYLLFIHLFVYTLIHSLQQQALHVEHTGLRLDDN